jgi:hypothetical protein
MGKVQHVYKTLENFKERYMLNDQFVGWRMMLNQIKQRWDESVWTEFIWPRTEPGGKLL